VGAGAVVRGDIAAHSVVAGVPARGIAKRGSSW
jgi:acetyltransferase-like isoleucine patch superfamily enzyme